MDDQAEYKVKQRPFHGEYTSPGQGKKSDQYNSSLVVLAYLAAVAFGFFFFVGLYTFGVWLWNHLTGM